MDSVIVALLSLFLGAILMYWFFSLTRKKRRRELIEHQSTIILDRIKRVCKLVSVEGDFAEIYNYENIREGILKITSKKKALLSVKLSSYW